MAQATKIKRSDLEHVKQIGEGGFSTVHEMIWKSNGYKQVAVKKLNIIESWEVDMLLKLQHENIVQLLGVVDEEMEFMLVLEYCEGGSLRSYLDEHSDKPLTSQLFYDWAEQAAKPIKYLKQMHVVHKDIKSPNYLVTNQNILKLADFGLAKNIKATMSNATGTATYAWMAPELAKDNKLSPTYDIFALAVVLWELWTREVPFKGKEGVNIMWMVCAEDKRLPIPSDCPQILADLMKQTWLTVWQDRPDIEHVLSVIKIAKSEALGLEPQCASISQGLSDLSLQNEEMKKVSRTSSTMSIDEQLSMEVLKLHVNTTQVPKSKAAILDQSITSLDTDNETSLSPTTPTPDDPVTPRPESEMSPPIQLGSSNKNQGVVSLASFIVDKYDDPQIDNNENSGGLKSKSDASESKMSSPIQSLASFIVDKYNDPQIDNNGNSGGLKSDASESEMSSPIQSLASFIVDKYDDPQIDNNENSSGLKSDASESEMSSPIQSLESFIVDKYNDPQIDNNGNSSGLKSDASGNPKAKKVKYEAVPLEKTTVGSWQFESSIGLQRGPGELNNPCGVVETPEGTIAVAEVFAPRVNLYRRDGIYLFDLNTNQKPDDRTDRDAENANIAASPDGKLFIADGTYFVKVFSTSGAYLGLLVAISPENVSSLDEEEAELVSVKVDQKARLLVGERVHKYISIHSSTSMEYISSIALQVEPLNISVTSQDNIIIGNFNVVQIIDYHGNVLHILEPPGMSPDEWLPRGICCHGNMVVVCNYYSKGICCFSLSGVYIGSIPTMMIVCRDVTFADNGRKLLISGLGRVKDSRTAQVTSLVQVYTRT